MLSLVRWVAILIAVAISQTILASSMPGWFENLLRRDSALVNYRATFIVRSEARIDADEIAKLKEFSRGGEILPAVKTSNHEANWDLNGGWTSSLTADSIEGAPSIEFGSNGPMVSDDRAVFTKPDSAPLEAYSSSILGMHPVIAAGVSRWKAVAFPDGGNSRATGVGAQGEDMTLSIDPESGLPSWMEVRIGEFLKRYAYANWTGSDFQYPSSVEYTLTRGGVVVESESFSQIELQLGMGRVSPENNWLKPGRIVEDQRVEPVVQFSYEELVGLSGGKTALTGDELLVFSKAKAETEARKQAWEKQMEGRTENPSLPNWMLIGLGLVLAGGGLLFWSKFRPKAS